MPEYPDITVYMEAIERHAGGRRLDALRIATPFLLRTVAPPPDAFAGARLTTLRRLGKRIAFGFDNQCWAVLHLMIAGRLHWNSKRKPLAVFAFESGNLVLTEAGSKRRASLHLCGSEAEARALDPGGLDPLTATPAQLLSRLQERNHTLKRALTDPGILSGIGNAYSDEILHHARLSPILLTEKLSLGTAESLHAAIADRLAYFTDLLRSQTGAGFPENVTAFRPEMAVHGKFGQPCPRCRGPVQRVVHAENECNYCPECQTGGRLLADRALSRLLGKDWPRTVEALELRKRGSS